MDIEELKHEIVQRLKPLNSEKVILFGSYAYGTPNKDSDTDLITHTKGMHKKFIEMDSMFSRKILKEGTLLI